jgi:hypothetical protein
MKPHGLFFLCLPFYMVLHQRLTNSPCGKLTHIHHSNHRTSGPCALVLSRRDQGHQRTISRAQRVELPVAPRHKPTCATGACRVETISMRTSLYSNLSADCGVVALSAMAPVEYTESLCQSYTSLVLLELVLDFTSRRLRVSTDRDLLSSSSYLVSAGRIEVTWTRTRVRQTRR